MRTSRPELRAVTVTILLGALALALAVVIGYAWWSAQRGLTRHAQEKVDIIAQFLENGMALLPAGGADREGLHALMEKVGEQYGASRIEVARGAATARQYGPSATSYAPDDLVQAVFQSGQCTTVLEFRDGQRTIRRLKVLNASDQCLACHDVTPGEILGILDVSFDLAQIQPVGPDFYRDLALVSLLVTVIVVLLVLLVFSRINMARRIEGVATLASDIAAGDLDRRVAPLPGAEMDGLAQAINDMAQALQAHEETLVRQQRELEEANRRLEVLVQESHHRIKNNLQTVADLLSLQISRCSVRGGSCLKDSIQRVKSIAAVHELLSVEQSESTDVKLLAGRLLGMAVRNTASPGQRIANSVDGDDLRLDARQATALALVLGELFNNALIHGLAGQPDGRIAVSIQAQDSRVTLTVRDDGAGLPPHFAWESREQLGLRIVRTLVRRELKGEFALQNGGPGAIATITFPYATVRNTQHPEAG